MKNFNTSDMLPFFQDVCIILGRIFEENNLIGTISTQKIYLMASKLLIRMATIIHPPGFLEMPTINDLMRRGSCLMHLPVEVIANIYISIISYMIFQQQQHSNVTFENLREYIEYLAAGFLQIDASRYTTSSDLDISSNTFNLLAIFSLVLDYFKTSNNNIKQLLANIFKVLY